jgi:hypothetical protein
MKLFRNLSLGVALGALTAAGGLLGAATTANAQGAPPGFFQIPGTTTALLITGQVGTRGIYDANDAAVDYPALMPISSDILIPLFIPATGNVSKSDGNNNGSFHFTAKDFSFGFITSTPTAWGNLGTVMIFGAGSNLNDPSGFSQAFQNVGVVVAFGTLGPWMAGMNGTLLSDDDAAPDTMGEPLALAGQLGGIQPGVRYTWKGPNGFSLAGSLEQNFTGGVASGFVGNFPNQLFSPGTNAILAGGGLASDGWGPDAPFNTGTLGGRTTWPDLILKARWDQPWGHVAGAFLLHQLSSACAEVQCVPTYDTNLPGPTGSTDALPNYTKLGWGFNFTGHLNTWGKDTLKGGVFFGKGLDHYMGDYGGNQGMEIGTGPACGAAPVNGGAASVWCGAYIPFSWGLYAAYQHFWTDQLRSTVGVGYSHVNNNVNYQTMAPGLSGALAFPFPSPICAGCSSFVSANVDNESHLSAVANLIWSPVPKVDLGIEYVWYRVTYLTNDAGVVGGSGNAGTDNRIVVESIFHF